MQSEIREEVLSFGSQGYSQENLKKMIKLQALINETLRLRVLGTIGFPRYASKDTTIQEFNIRKGWYVQFNGRFNHYLDFNFHDPFKFDHSRWLNDID